MIPNCAVFPAKALAEVSAIKLNWIALNKSNSDETQRAEMQDYSVEQWAQECTETTQIMPVSFISHTSLERDPATPTSPREFQILVGDCNSSMRWMPWLQLTGTDALYYCIHNQTFVLKYGTRSCFILAHSGNVIAQSASVWRLVGTTKCKRPHRPKCNKWVPDWYLATTTTLYNPSGGCAGYNLTSIIN